MDRDKLVELKNQIKDFQKEQFRQFLIENGVADKCVIDNNTYTRLSLKVGCFKYGGLYFVYNTDEKCEYYDIKRYERQIDAYKDVASRFNLEYQPNNQMKK